MVLLYMYFVTLNPSYKKTISCIVQFLCSYLSTVLPYYLMKQIPPQLYVIVEQYVWLSLHLPP